MWIFKTFSNILVDVLLIAIVILQIVFFSLDFKEFCSCLNILKTLENKINSNKRYSYSSISTVHLSILY